MLKNCRFKEHPNPLKASWKGFILDDKGKVLAYVKLDGSIITNNLERGDKNV